MQNQTETFWEKLNRITKKIADFQAKVILTILYVIVALPTGLVVRISEDALALRHETGRAGYWRPRRLPKDTLHEAQRQG